MEGERHSQRGTGTRCCSLTLASTPTAPEKIAAFSLSVNDDNAVPAVPPLVAGADPPRVLPRTDGNLVHRFRVGGSVEATYAFLGMFEFCCGGFRVDWCGCWYRRHHHPVIVAFKLVPRRDTRSPQSCLSMVIVDNNKGHEYSVPCTHCFSFTSGHRCTPLSSPCNPVLSPQGLLKGFQSFPQIPLFLLHRRLHEQKNRILADPEAEAECLLEAVRCGTAPPLR